MTLDRRTVVRGTAWAVPAVAISTQAPAFAASPCAAVPFPTSWRITSAGTFNGDYRGYSSSYPIAFGGPGYPSGDPVVRYVVEADNSDSGTETQASRNASVTLERDLTLQPGRAYTFQFTIASRFSSDNIATSQNQFLTISTVETSVATSRLRLVKGNRNTTSQGTLSPTWTSLATGTGVTLETFSFTFTPGAAAVTLRYVYLLPARQGLSGQADIAVSAPTITGC
jgi:hypothetical protein